MRDAIKMTGLFVVGLTVAIIVYPLMHELGHSLIALLVGAMVTEVSILPLPRVLCEVGNVDNIGVAAIGLSGMILPFFISVVIRPKRFWGWYANYIVKGISLLAFVVSAISTICFMIGKPLPNDDITQILSIWPGGEWLCLLLSIILAMIATRKLIYEKPIVWCFGYFE